MLNTTDKFIKHKAGLLNLAEEPGNVSKACQVMGMSRDTFYRYKAAVEEGGVEALFERNRRKPNLANRVDEATEQAVVKSALAFPAYGQARTANALRKQGGQTVTQSPVEIVAGVLNYVGVRAIVTGWGPDSIMAAQRQRNLDAFFDLAVEYESYCESQHEAATLTGFLFWLEDPTSPEFDLQPVVSDMGPATVR